MPSKTIHLNDEQYAYVVGSKDDSFSERVRELVDKGMEVEQDE